MVDYLENVCLHRYEKAYQKELKVMTPETPAAVAPVAAVEEAKEPEAKEAEIKAAEIRKTPARETAVTEAVGDPRPVRAAEEKPREEKALEAVSALEGFERPEFHIWLARELAARSK